MHMTVNGVAVSPPDDPRVSLLDLLREQLGLTGTKKGRNQGGCGARKPWRARKADAALRGQPATDAAFAAAAEAELADARPLKDNGFEIELARRTLVAVLGEFAGDGA